MVEAPSTEYYAGPLGETMATEDSALEQLKTPPHSREAEQSLLGGLLLDAQTWDQISGMVTKEDFYLPQH